jgi:hypothetical protein
VLFRSLRVFAMERVQQWLEELGLGQYSEQLASVEA